MDRIKVLFGFGKKSGKVTTKTHKSTKVEDSVAQSSNECAVAEKPKTTVKKDELKEEETIETKSSSEYRLKGSELSEWIYCAVPSAPGYPPIEPSAPEEYETAWEDSEFDDSDEDEPGATTSYALVDINLRGLASHEGDSLGPVASSFPPDLPVRSDLPRAQSIEERLNGSDPLETTFVNPLEEIASYEETIDSLDRLFESSVGENIFADLTPPRVTLESILDENDLYQLRKSELQALLVDYQVAFDSESDDYEQLVVKVSELLFQFREITMDEQTNQTEWKQPKEEKENAEECKICMDNQVDCVFVDCGHMIACRECSDRLETCPVCRCRIERLITVYR